ncbi:glycosyl hydrolase family 76 [Fulvivirga sp. M361]|uniref:glycoside hydrolase family 76 protein n=1 Tax=Fulvivirga sp. M361 TaxID=2594266 RepID=UPI00117B84EB|nr:glycoside hydrolase family 76 protein [Fulvivirga sp. M361]TRX46362.1 glycosyl hydrolase family 76 [Fulvivirga sp. M361]
MKFSDIYILVFSILMLCSACEDEDLGPLRDPTARTEIEYTWSATADSMQEAAYTTYLTPDGTFRKDDQGDEAFNYWWNAHAVDVLVDGYLRTDDGVYVSRVKALVEGIYTKNNNTFHNEFNDDMVWLAIACTNAFKATDDAYYLNVSKELWTEILKSWSDLYGGGITWKTNTPNSKNAVSNAPVAILGLRLYDIEKNEDYLQWAKDIYAWQKSTLVDPTTGLVWDHIDLVDGEVTIKKEWVFTYNIGTWVGAAMELYQVTEDNAYLDDAVRSATSMMTSPQLTTEGLLRSEGQGDGGLFKGILVRYFTRLILLPELSESKRKSFIDFFRFNAETFYEKGLARPSMLCGPDWRRTPDGLVDFSTQLSGMMLMEAVALLDQNNVFDE